MPDIVESGDWFLGLVAAAALFVAFRRDAFGGALLLAPTNLDDPTGERIGDRLLFRFVPVTSLTRRQTFLPRVLLGMATFTILSILAYVFLPAAAGWEAFVSRLAGWLFLLGLIGGLWRLIPLAVLAFTGAAASDWDPMWSGVSFGIAFGVFGGKMVFANYRAVLEDTRLAVRSGRYRTGRSPGLVGRTIDRLSLAFLYLVPFMILYEVVRPFRPDIDLQLIAGQGMAWQEWRYALYLVAIMMGLNVVLFVRPFFREMLERCSIQTALGFNYLVLKAEKQEKLQAEGQLEEDLQYGDVRKEVQRFFDDRGRWVYYGYWQGVLISLVACVFIVSTVVNATSSFMEVGFVERTASSEAVVVALSWFMICTNSVIVLLFLGSGVRRFGRARSWTPPWRQTVESAWSAIDDPGRAFTCHQEGQEVRVRAVTGGSPS